MRPVNLIPTDERRGERTAMRGGPAAYIVVGALIAALAGVTALVITGNQISDRKTEVASLRKQDAVVKARARRLAAYTQFGSVRDQRVATVTSLADSRFDWQRVMHELALILPDDVWLTSLTGKANPGVQIDGEANIAVRASIPGPALELIGCARGQDAVAGFVSDLKDIDGVTRVGVQSSQLGSQASTAASTGSAVGGSTTSSCQTRNFVAQFQIVAAFDAAPIAATATDSATAPTAPAPAPSTGSTPATTPATPATSSTPASTSGG